jgi:hypothetical protein
VDFFDVHYNQPILKLSLSFFAQFPRKESEMMQPRSFFRNGRAIRLIIAFLVGIPLGVFAGKVGTGLQNVIPYLLFPLLIGAICAFTVGRRKQHPHLLTLGTGLLTWGGIGVSLVIMTAQATLTPCNGGSCASSTTSLLGSLLIFYLPIGLILVALGALTTSILLRRFRQVR